MSLDVLFTEAAEAGGPPRFTEDDIAQRVGDRHRRRRRLATGAAVLIVLGGVGLGVYLSGRGDEPSPVVQPAEIPAVPVTEEALIGEWQAVVPPDRPLDQARSLTFAANGTYDHRGCNNFSGRWNLSTGRLGLSDPGAATQLACDDYSMAADTAVATGVATLYGDGLLRIAARGTSIDYVREDDPTPADPADPREPATAPIVPTEAALLGEWRDTANEPMARNVPFLEFTDGGRYTFSGCNDGAGDWAIDGSRLTLDEPIETTLRTCGALPGQPLLDVALPGSAELTTEGDLVLRGPHGAIFLRRTGTDAASTGGLLTDRRWVRYVGVAPAVSLALWIEFTDDGTFTMTGSCGLVHGTWTTTGEEVSVTVTDPGNGDIANCAHPERAVDALGPIARIRVGDELVIEHEPQASPGGRPATGPLQAFRPLDAMAVPTEDDLVGEWFSGPAGSGGSNETLVTFHDERTLTFGDCPAVPWHVGDGVLSFEGAEDACLVGYGFEPPVDAFDVRLDGEVLYLSGPSTMVAMVPAAEHMLDTSVSARGPGPTLRQAYADMGVTACCQVNGDGLTRRGFVWEGHQVGVEALVRTDYLDQFALDEATFDLDGQVVSGGGERGTELAFDCGGYRFGVYSWADPVPLNVLLDAADALLPALPCTAAAPSYA